MIWLRAFVLLGAWLSFSMEPLLGRLLLPQYGGAVYVWGTTLMFFQGVLLAGYAYAHWLGPRLGKWHLWALLIPLVALPFRAPALGAETIAGLIWALARSCGLAFLLLSSTSVLAQRWLSHSALPEREHPYALYSASNLGSLGALLVYALLAEPLLGVRAQSWIWAGLYGVYLLVAWRAYGLCAPSSAPAPDWGERPPARALGFWALLAAGPSALSLAVTNLTIVEIGNAPLLWVLPLSLYLLSFILAFGRSGTPGWVVRLLPHFCAAAIGVSLLSHGVAENWRLGILYMALAFVISWSAHGALYESRPPVPQLGWFYLALALGGWLGGAFVALVAPSLFSQLREFALAVAVTLCSVAVMRKSWRMPRSHAYALAGFLLVLGMAAIPVLTLSTAGYRVVEERRSPYGVYRVVDTELDGKFPARVLTSGQTRHGAQLFRADRTLDPTPITYYDAASPLGRALAALPRPRQVGVIGLGIGTVAGLLEAGDSVVFYEIDPLVEQLARADFGYLSQARAQIEVRIGDARRQLAREAELGAERFQILVVDAFTGDGIPVHLLTTEALSLYLRRVRAGGTVLLHTSNRFVPLMGVIEAGARQIGTDSATQTRVGNLPFGATPSQFAAIGNVSGLGWSSIRGGGAPWTDDHSSLLPLLAQRLLH
jgi:hypothetical protein